jgi:hypothetical protein
MGKVRSAICTTAVLSSLPSPESVIAVNIGIAGCRPGTASTGDLLLINKITDASSRLRFYPDILLRHGLPERSLVTHDAPVTCPPESDVLVDMEAAGFFQAASAFVPPSQILVLKIVSDYCDGSQVTPEAASALVAEKIPHIATVVDDWGTQLPVPDGLAVQDEQLLSRAVAAGRFTTAQTIELTRLFRHKLTIDPNCREHLAAVASESPRSKIESKALFDRVLRSLGRGDLP